VVFGGSKVRPRLDATFRRDEKLEFYLQLYNFRPDEKTGKPNGTIEYEVVSDGSGEKVLDFTEEVAAVPFASPTEVTVEKMIPLKTFVAGRYTLKIKVEDRNCNKVLTLVATFTVS
jgi:hypothetical protein